MNVHGVTRLGFRTLSDNEVGDDQVGGRRAGGELNLRFRHRITVTPGSLS